MKNPFKRENISYKGGEPFTPYQRAQQEWDSRIGSSREQARNWRILAILSTLVSVLLITVIILVSASRKEHLYIAEVTKEGKVVNVAPLLVRYQPTDAQKEYFIAHFVELVRSIPMDPVVAKKNWITAYNFLNSRGAERLSYYFKESNPIAMLGKKTVSVQISDINPISQATINVNWIEITIGANGKEEAKKNYSGIFTIAIKQPTKSEEILRNPLGLRIIDFSIKSKESK
jgi:type IV secretory pathway TrbF-like protein